MVCEDVSFTVFVGLSVTLSTKSTKFGSRYLVYSAPLGIWPIDTCPRISWTLVRVPCSDMHQSFTDALVPVAIQSNKKNQTYIAGIRCKVNNLSTYDMISVVENDHQWCWGGVTSVELFWGVFTYYTEVNSHPKQWQTSPNSKIERLISYTEHSHTVIAWQHLTNFTTFYAFIPNAVM